MKAESLLSFLSYAPKPVIKGRAGNVIVVRTPNPMFSEAIFILKDDIFATRELSRKEILRQAKAAAKDYTASVRGQYPLWLCCLVSAIMGGGVCLAVTMLL